MTREQEALARPADPRAITQEMIFAGVCALRDAKTAEHDEQETVRRILVYALAQPKS